MSESKHLPNDHSGAHLRNVFHAEKFGIVLSGGGSRAAYQVGALKALLRFIESHSAKVSVVVGSSMGALNGIILAGCLKGGLDSSIAELESIWRERTYRNTFNGSPTRAFLKALRIAVTKYASPGPDASALSLFDPSPLAKRVDEVLERNGGLTLGNRAAELDAVGVMTTVEGQERKPLLFVSARKPIEPAWMSGASFEVCYIDKMTAMHGLASAALPSVLPPVEIDVEIGRVRLVDGGICENIPVDPAVRLGAENVVLIDVSGRSWWHDQFGTSYDTKPSWEIPAPESSFCVRPTGTIVIRNQGAMGPYLKDVAKSSHRHFISALGPTWPAFTLIKRKLGEALAFEVMSYVALHPDYISSLIKLGFDETTARLSELDVASGSALDGTTVET